MPSDVPNLATIREHFESLVRCLLKYAEQDAAFAEDLVQALTSVKPVKAAKVKTEIEINLVETLKEKGAEELIQVLAGLPLEELKKIAGQYKVTDRDRRRMSQRELVECLTQKAKERLGRGGVFLDVEARATADGDAREPAEAEVPTEQKDATPATPADGDGGGG